MSARPHITGSGARVYRSTSPDRWTMPRSVQDASQRLRVHGKVLPMEQPRTAYHRLGHAWKACIWGAGLIGAALLVDDVAKLVGVML